MKFKNTNTTISDHEIVCWDQKYSVGIKLIDDQHRELVNLTNKLYESCMTRDTSIEAVFNDAMHRMVEYVRMHFTAENLLLERIGFPNHFEHKKLHETLVKDILAAVKSYEEGNKLIPNQFVRTLKEWVFGHIAIFDQTYALYIHEQVKKGLIKKEQLE